MKCEHIEPLLTGYMLGDVDEQARRDVGAHLEGCASCRAEAELIQATLGDVRMALQARPAGEPKLDPARRQKILKSRHHRSFQIPDFLKIAAILVVMLGWFGAIFIPALSKSSRGQYCKISAHEDVGSDSMMEAAPEMLAGEHEVPDSARPTFGVPKARIVNGSGVLKDVVAGVPASPMQQEDAYVSGDMEGDFRTLTGNRRFAENDRAGNETGMTRPNEVFRFKHAEKERAVTEQKTEQARVTSVNSVGFYAGYRSRAAAGDKVSAAPSGVGIGSGDATVADGFEVAMAKSPLVMRGLLSARADKADRKVPASGTPQPSDRDSWDKDRAEVKEAKPAREGSGREVHYRYLPTFKKTVAIGGKLELDTPSMADDVSVTVEGLADASAPVATPAPVLKQCGGLVTYDGITRTTAGVVISGTATNLVTVVLAPALDLSKNGSGVLTLIEEDQRRDTTATLPPPTFNGVEDCAKNPFSTFGIDVDTASFTLARRYLLGGQLPPPGAIRVEEVVNAFDYHYPSPDRKMFAVYTDRARSPFRPNLELLRIGVRGKVIGRDQQRPSMLTFVIDTSGSMNTPDRLPLIQKSLALLLGSLKPQDTVTLITFGTTPRLVLDSTSASQVGVITNAINSLQTQGSTHLEGGVRLGYETAARHFRSGAINRVVLLSDGVANLGAATATEILGQVEAYRKQGVYCSVFGFGQGNYDDAMLQTLADKGDGVYRFVDSLAEAKRVFVDDLSAMLNVIAKDVKIQVEFDPARVKSYRQLGYEKRHLEKEQFRDDTVDAGEVGSGQSATALYELDVTGTTAEPLGTVRVRWRDVETGQIAETAQPIRAGEASPSFDDAPIRFKLAAGLAEFAEKLRESPYASETSLDSVTRVLRPIGLELNLDRQIQDLVRMAEMASKLKRK